MESKSQIKKEFNEFAQKIARLESLRAELEAMDTRGFTQDVNIIKAKLKNIDKIDEVEREIKNLRRKIEARRVGVPVYAVKPSEDTTKLKKKILELESLINRKQVIKEKNPVSSKELKHLKDIPKLEKELEELKKKFESHNKFAKGKIDTGVGIIVDDKFREFIEEIKVEVSKRLGDQEKEMNRKLQSDLKSRESVFKKKYEEMVKRCQVEHDKSMHEGLRSEIEKRFEDRLRRKLEQEKAKMMSDLIKDNAKKIHDEKAKIMEKLDAKYKRKDERKMAAEIEKLKKNMYAEFKKRVDALRDGKIVEKEIEKKKERVVKVVKTRPAKIMVEKKARKAKLKKNSKKAPKGSKKIILKDKEEKVEDQEIEVENVVDEVDNDLSEDIEETPKKTMAIKKKEEVESEDMEEEVEGEEEEVESEDIEESEEKEDDLDELEVPKNKEEDVDLGLPNRFAGKTEQEVKSESPKGEKGGFFSLFRKKKSGN